jgi:hypothetical protein
MLARHFDAEHMNRILNDPNVRPDVADVKDGPLDISSSVENRNNVLLMAEHGGCMFFQTLPGIYEVHTVCDTMGRGPWIAKFVLDAGDWMFTKTPCFEITTRIPAEHRGAKRLAMHAGFMPEFVREGGCVWRGKKMDVEIYSFRVQDWIKRSSTFEEKGRAFHDFLHSEAERLGVTAPAHPDDPSHNRYVGSSLEMAENGQVSKGVNWYNRWAVSARHPTISLLSSNPLEIKMDLGILRLVDGKMRVDLPC